MRRPLNNVLDHARDKRSVKALADNIQEGTRRGKLVIQKFIEYYGYEENKHFAGEYYDEKLWVSQGDIEASIDAKLTDLSTKKEYFIDVKTSAKKLIDYRIDELINIRKNNVFNLTRLKGFVLISSPYDFVIIEAAKIQKALRPEKYERWDGKLCYNLPIYKLRHLFKNHKTPPIF